MPALGLGNVVKDPVSVSGGLLHRMYHVTTSAGEYAVKVLNPNIMQRPHALQNTIYSEKIAKAFEGLIPLIASLEIGGLDTVEKIRGRCVKEVKQVNREIKFEDALRYQNGWD